jgi:hypothetical protein
MVRLHGEGVNWKEQELNPMACTLAEGERAMDGELMVSF